MSLALLLSGARLTPRAHPGPHVTSGNSNCIASVFTYWSAAIDHLPGGANTRRLRAETIAERLLLGAYGLGRHRTRSQINVTSCGPLQTMALPCSVCSAERGSQK